LQPRRRRDYTRRNLEEAAVSVFRAKIWTGMGAAVVLGAGLAACGGEGGEAGASGGESGSAVSASTAGEGDEAGLPPAAINAGGEGDEAGPGGEQGASAAYAGAPAGSRRALRLAQLKGFFLAAKALGAAQGPEAAAALAGQGMLEVFDPAKAEIGTADFDEAPLRKAAQSGDRGALDAAVRTLDAAERKAGGDPSAVARGLTAVSVGLYREALAGGQLDPIEYQHAYAAALAAQSVAARGGKLAGAKGDIDRLVRLWPSPVAPENAAKAPPLAEVQAQASRIELALSGA
jgi:hypothetical protein